MAVDDLVDIRPKEDGDIGYVISAWLASYAKSSFAKHMDREIYFKNHRNLVEGLIENFVVNIACLKEDSTRIAGFVCGDALDEDTALVHYVCVKDVFRGMRIGQKLLMSIGPRRTVVTSHHTKMYDKAFPGGYYNPYLSFWDPRSGQA